MKKILSLLVCSFSFAVSFAQLDNTVEVTNDAKPVVTDVTKMPVKTKPAETKVTHYSMEYAVGGQQLTNYAPEPLGNYESEAVWKGNKRGYLHLGGGVLGKVDGEVAYQFDLTNNDALTVDLSLKGFNGKAKDNKYYSIKDWKSRFYQNRAALKYNHRFDNGVDFFVKGAFENHLFNYMGYGYGVTDKQHNVLGSASMGFTPYKTGNLTIDATAGIDFFSQNYRTRLEKELGETVLRLKGNAQYQFTDEHHVGLGVGVIHTAYGNDELDGITSFRFTPHYLYKNEDLEAKLGVFVSSKGNVAPDASLTYHLNPNSDLYVNVSGYEEDNDFRHLSAIHPYFIMNGYSGGIDGAGIIKMEPAFHQVDARIGYRFKGFNGFSGDISGGFDQSKNHADVDWATNATNGLVYPLIRFMKNKCFYINADFVYAYEDIVKVNAHNRLNIESNKNVGADWLEGSYITPAFEMDWKADFKLMKDLYLGLDWKLECYSDPNIMVVPGPAYERPNTLNLGASIRYTLPIDLPLTLFVKGDNLLNQNYDRYFGYRNIGANFLGGFALSF